MYSGRTSARLLELSGPRDFARLLADAGDVDGDGIHDLVVSGEPGPIMAERQLALASVISSGKLLSRVAATEPLERLVAPPLSVGPEFTGDGPGVVLVTVSFDERRARLSMLGLRNQKLLRSVLLTGRAQTLPYFANQFCLGRWQIHESNDEPACLVSQADGTVWSVAMRTGAITTLRSADRDLDIAGVQMAVAGSIDGDDVPDYWIGTYADGPGKPVMYAISGGDGWMIYGCGKTYEDLCELDVDPRAGAVAAVGDVDGDNVCDVLIGTSYAYGGQQGAAFLVSGESGKVIFGLTRMGDGVRVIRP